MAKINHSVTWQKAHLIDFGALQKLICPNPDFSVIVLTLVLLNPDIPYFANSVDPDQLASEEANWSGSALFASKYANL